MSDSPEPDLDDFIVAMLRDVDETPAAVRTRQIATAVRHLRVESSTPSRVRRLGVAATILLVVGGIVVLATNSAERRSDETISVAGLADGAGSGDAAEVRDDGSKTRDEGSDAFSADVSTEATTSTLATAPAAGAQSSPEQAMNFVELGEFADIEAARHAAVDAHSLESSKPEAADRSTLPSVGVVACPLPPDVGSPLWWGTGTIGGHPYVMAVVRNSGSGTRALVTPIGACAWS
ncbi:MAG: hypothetical protein IT195_11050 [Microthrixaceae bacterium]|nr:hypothetical protein [Microthrixaceae bacterium]